MLRISATRTRKARISNSPRNRWGFTLIELIVVCSVLVLLASVVVPNIVSMKASDDQNSALAGVRRIAADARERAITAGIATQVTYDESAHELDIVQVQDDGTTSILSRTPLTTGVEPQRFQLEGREVAASDFKLTFAPDGHSNGGGLEFPNLSVSVDQTGVAQIVDGPLPQPEESRWEAGDLAPRQ